ncbi:MAG: pilin [Minisyncoccia bacterium]
MPLVQFGGFIIYLINAILVPLVFAIAFIVFIWGVFEYFIAGAANEEKRKEGRNLVVYSLIGFFLMISVWGIVNLLVNSFGFNRQNQPRLPTVSGGGGGFGGAGGFGNEPRPSIFTNREGTGLFDLVGSLFRGNNNNTTGGTQSTGSAAPQTCATPCLGNARCVNGSCVTGPPD